jgi:hypothetical protein
MALLNKETNMVKPAGLRVDTENTGATKPGIGKFLRVKTTKIIRKIPDLQENLINHPLPAIADALSVLCFLSAVTGSTFPMPIVIEAMANGHVKFGLEGLGYTALTFSTGMAGAFLTDTISDALKSNGF